MMARFHLALFVKDLDTTRAFYADMLGCREGRSSEIWVDFDCAPEISQIARRLRARKLNRFEASEIIL